MALHKPYLLSNQPNYGQFNGQLPNKALTDGKYAFGLFWEQKSTLGWEGIKTVTITIDLLKVENVGQINFNTASRKAAGVFFPANILIFISKDNKSFQYVGDATANGNNVTGDYAVEKFTINKINQLARYVHLKIVATQNNIFCDEIEVIKGNKSALKFLPFISKDKIEAFALNQLSIEKKRKQIIQHINVLSQDKIDLKTRNSIHLAELKIKHPIVNSNLLEEANKFLQGALAIDLTKRFGTKIIINSANPWQHIPLFMIPVANTNHVTIKQVVAHKSNLYTGVTLTNTTTLPQQLIISQRDNQTIKLFEAYQTATLEGNFVPDALIPLVNHIKLNPGETKLIIINAVGTNMGSLLKTITFSNAKLKVSLTLDMKVAVKVAKPSLNAINWGYLNQPMIQNDKLKAAADLESHYVNVVSIPEQYVPTLIADNFNSLNQYLIPFKDVKKILIEMNYSQERYKFANSFGAFMSTAWKNQFKRWYTNIIANLKKEGYNEQQVYLFPYDEVRGKNINDLKAFTLWLHATLPQAKVYATLEDDEAIEELTSTLDIAQILWSKTNAIEDRDTKKNEIWTYNTQGFSRTLHPHSYYRLMSWRAYLYNFSGIGFWNYADIGAQNKNVYSLAAPERDYAIIYHNLTNNIVSSRRWEAFKLGIEEYEIIKQYGIVFGKDEADKFVNQVIQNEHNFEMADLTIQKMLTSLQK